MIRKIIALLLTALLAGCVTMAEGIPADQKWTPEELLAGMTLREKVGQLFVVQPEVLNMDSSGSHISGGAYEVTDAMRTAYEQYPVGGFALFSANIASPVQLRRYVEDLRGLGRVLPLIAVDEEGGTVSRLANKSALGLTNVGSMSKLKTEEEARRAGETVGEYLADYGFTLDFAPVADVLSNPKNGTIGRRSFGSDPQHVSQMVSAFIDGLHAHGVMSCIKHFPGHGGTSGDTHKGFVSLNKTGSELMQTELVPFIGNMEKTDVIMVAHITLSKVDKSGLPASLSRQILTQGLREGLGYQGVIITDSLKMGAITDSYKSDEAAVRALWAGVDLLLMPASLTRAFNGVMKAVENGTLSESRIDESVLRILRLKLADRAG